jgi:hypothetical protein
MLAIEISKRTVTPRGCFAGPPERLPVPFDKSFSGRLTCCRVNGFDEICSKCAVLKEKQEEAKRKREESKKKDLNHTASRDRMRKKAKLQSNGKNSDEPPPH